jgi:hypothetical protein
MRQRREMFRKVPDRQLGLSHSLLWSGDNVVQNQAVGQALKVVRDIRRYRRYLSLSATLAVLGNWQPNSGESAERLNGGVSVRGVAWRLVR